MSPRLIWIVTGVLAACEHGAPFRPAKYSPDGPFSSLSPIRLTFNPGTDLAPLWVPGSNEILYMAERSDRADEDRCLALMPGGGGAIARYACSSTNSDDSTNAFEEAAVSGDGRIAYVRVSTHRLPNRPVPPDVQALVVAPLDDQNDVRVLRPLAYTAPSDSIHQGVAFVHWLDANRLVYLGQRVVYPRDCSSCAPDTVATGIEIVTLDFAGATPELAIVAGTDNVSSLTVGATGDTIYFTRNGDSRVYRRAFSSGQTDTVFDFGAAGIARDLSIHNGRLLAVVGGDVSFQISPTVGPIQLDNGGPMHFVTLSSGAEAIVGTDLARFRRPAFSPDGARVVVEIRQPDGTADLWLLDVP